MSRKRSEEAIEAFRGRFVEGAAAKGVDGEPASLIRDGQRRGVEVRPPDVDLSDWKCVHDEGAVRIGLAYLTDVGEEKAKALVRERDRGGRFANLRDLAQRAPLT